MRRADPWAPFFAKTRRFEKRLRALDPRLAKDYVAVLVSFVEALERSREASLERGMREAFGQLTERLEGVQARQGRALGSAVGSPSLPRQRTRAKAVEPSAELEPRRADRAASAARRRALASGTRKVPGLEAASEAAVIEVPASVPATTPLGRPDRESSLVAGAKGRT